MFHTQDNLKTLLFEIRFKYFVIVFQFMVKVGLLMTTYNEEKVIKRCLESILPFFDYYSIGVDEKTTDNTKAIIEDTLKNKTGIVFDSPWNGFADARNQAFKKFHWDVDWYFIFDADMVAITQGFNVSQLDSKEIGYFIPIKKDGYTWDCNWIINANFDWEWKGVLHEYLECKNNNQMITNRLGNIYFNHLADGGGRDKGPNLWKRDADILLKGLVEETDPYLIRRYTYYLANSYRDAEMKKEAILFYHIRANMGGWNEELYLSNYYAGLLSENPQDYINALKIIPTRYDALIELIRYGYFKNKREIIEIGLTHYNEILNGNDTWNKEGLFFQKREFELHKMVSIGLAKNQRYKEAVELTGKLLDEITNNDNYFDFDINEINQEDINHLKNNLTYYKSKL